MAAYIVAYELEPEVDEAPVVLAIKAYKTWARISTFVWVVVSDETARDIRNKLRPLVGEMGRLVVVKSGGTGAWSNVKCRDEWLKKHL